MVGDRNVFYTKFSTPALYIKWWTSQPNLIGYQTNSGDNSLDRFPHLLIIRNDKCSNQSIKPASSSKAEEWKDLWWAFRILFDAEKVCNILQVNILENFAILLIIRYSGIIDFVTQNCLYNYIFAGSMFIWWVL